MKPLPGQLGLFPDVPEVSAREAYARRHACRGRCGRWWYYEGRGRPREWCPECYPAHRRERKRPDAPNYMSPAIRRAMREAEYDLDGPLPGQIPLFAQGAA